jgi:hypothetical protein
VERLSESIRKNLFQPRYAPRQAGTGGANLGHASRPNQASSDRRERTERTLLAAAGMLRKGLIRHI